MNLGLIDEVIIGVYLAVIITIGFVVKRKSASGIESYFLGNRKLPWWMLAMSGSSSYFDITGTMWIVSLFIMLGPRAMWIQFVWGFIIAAFYMAYMGKWIRRSRVITGAEWMIKRFGSGRQGDLARLSYTVYAIVTISALLGYTAVGMGKFGVEFLPIKNPHLCAALIIGITGVYVVVGGFRGLIIVEFFQTIILTIGALIIAYVGYNAFHTTAVPADWYSVMPKWTLTPQSAPTSVHLDPTYYMFGAILIVYVMKGLLLCASGPEQLYDFQKFLAVKNAREASLMGMLWGVFHTVRFPMAMGVAAIGIASLTGHGHILNSINSDPERALPAVIANSLGPGLRGIALAALIAGFMGTFSAMVNGGASYLVRDIYQRYIRPAASDRQLVTASYIASLIFILVGIAISMFATSINVLLTWIMATLGAGVLMPNVLRWYWARLNGWGYFTGTLTGMVLSLVQAGLEGTKLLVMPVYITFPILVVVVLAVTVITTLMTPPTESDVLKKFYRDVQPAGAWGWVADMVKRDEPSFRKKEPFAIDLLNVCIAVPWLAALYTAPVFLVLHQIRAAAIAGGIALVLSIALALVWWPSLPAVEDDSSTTESASSKQDETIRRKPLSIGVDELL